MADPIMLMNYSIRIFEVWSRFADKSAVAAINRALRFFVGSGRDNEFNLQSRETFLDESG
jgi:hypothetical protein